MNKKYLIPIIAILLILSGFIFFHKKSTTQTQVIKLKTQSVENKYKSIDKNAIKEIKIIKPIQPKLGYKSNTVVLQNKDNTFTQINSYSLGYGFRNNLGLYLDLAPDLGGGLSYDTFYFWRLNLNLLAGYPRIGIGMSYQLFNNTFIGIDDSLNYLKILQEPGIFVSLNF